MRVRLGSSMAGRTPRPLTLALSLRPGGEGIRGLGEGRVECGRYGTSIAREIWVWVSFHSALANASLTSSSG